jgi:hypothetical protein
MARTNALCAAALEPLGYQVAFEGFHGRNLPSFACPDANLLAGEKLAIWFVHDPSVHGGHAVITGCQHHFGPL